MSTAATRATHARRPMAAIPSTAAPPARTTMEAARAKPVTSSAGTPAGTMPKTSRKSRTSAAWPAAVRTMTT